MREFKDAPQQIDGAVAAYYAEIIREFSTLEDLLDDISVRMRSGELVYMSLGLRALIRRNKKFIHNARRMKMFLEEQIERKPMPPVPKPALKVVEKIDD